jgi:hypothetical protein
MLRIVGGSLGALLLVGCPGDGVPTGGSSESGLGTSSGAVSMSETGATPTSTPTTSGTSETTVADGSDGSSGGTTVVVGSSGGSTGGSTGPVALCGPPCDAPWVHEGSLTIDNKTDLASLRCLVEVTGTLQLSQVGQSPPAELGNLRKIGFQLSAGWEDTMTSLAGLECLEFIGDALSLQQNAVLADISALAGVKHIGGLTLWGSPLVTDLSLFDGVTGLRRIDLWDMSAVPRLPVPGPDTSLSELKIKGCDAMTDLDALAGVPGDPMGIQVMLVDDPKLTSIAGLGGLWSGEDWLYLDSLPALKSLAGIEGIEGSDNGQVFLRHLPLVPDLEALAGIDVLGTLYLDGMPKLTTLAPLAGLREVQDLTLGSCSELYGGLGLDGLTTLAPLEGLEIVGKLGIARNGALTKLPQFTALKFDIGQAILIDNPKLSAMQVDAFLTEHGGCAQPPMECVCNEDFDMP